MAAIRKVLGQLPDTRGEKRCWKCNQAGCVRARGTQWYCSNRHHPDVVEEVFTLIPGTITIDTEMPQGEKLRGQQLDPAGPSVTQERPPAMTAKTLAAIISWHKGSPNQTLVLG